MFAQGLFRVSFYKLPSNLRLNPNTMTYWPVIWFQFAEPTWFDELHAGRTVTKTCIFSKPVAVLFVCQIINGMDLKTFSAKDRLRYGFQNGYTIIIICKLDWIKWELTFEINKSRKLYQGCLWMNVHICIFPCYQTCLSHLRTIKKNFEHLFKSRLHHKGTWNVSWPLVAASWLSFFSKP